MFCQFCYTDRIIFGGVEFGGIFGGEITRLFNVATHLVCCREGGQESIGEVDEGGEPKDVGDESELL